MASVEFADLKRSVSILQVLDMLDIKVTHQYGETRRATCPLCKGRKCLAATPGKGFFCHNKNCGAKGSIIDLVQKVRSCTEREAALAIQDYVGDPTPRTPKPETDQTAKLNRILDRLQPEHEAIQALGISPETARAFDSGFNPSGNQRGRYSVAVRGLNGELLAFAGIALTDSDIAFSNFNPETALFNQHRLNGEVTLYRSILDAILAVEYGAPIQSVTAFLTETIRPTQLEYLAGLLDHHQIEALVL